MLLTVAEFSQSAGVSKKRIYSDLEGKLKDYARKVNGITKIDDAAISLYKASNTERQEQAAPKQDIAREEPQIDIEQPHNEQEQRIDNSREEDAKQEIDIDAKGKEQAHNETENEQSIIAALRSELASKQDLINHLLLKIDEKDALISELIEKNSRIVEQGQMLTAMQQQTIMHLQEPKKKLPGIIGRIFGKKQKEKPGDMPPADA